MEGFISFLSGTLVLIGVVIGWIIAYKRIRDDWLHGALIFFTSLTIILSSAHPWETFTGGLPWALYASGASLPFTDALLFSGVALVLSPICVEVMWWVTCLLRLIARYVPTPKQP